MTLTPIIPILGMACASHVGENLTGNPSPAVINSNAAGISSAYYTIGDDLDNPDRQFNILDHVIEQALQRSGLSTAEIENIGLFLGSSSYDLRSSELEFMNQLESKQPVPIPVTHAGSSRMSDWVGNRFNISSDAFNINTACTSSANALLSAQNMLHHGIFKHTLVIGIELFNETTLAGFSSLQLLATERLAPFDKDRDGLLLGEGCAAVVLGSTPCSSPFGLVGGGTSFDLYSITATHENGSSIADSVASALAASKTEPSEIVAIKAQGSGSHINDLAESRGLHTAFHGSIPPVTAIKPYIGHTLGACGVLELVLFCNALTAGSIPRTPNFSLSDPDLSITPITSDKTAEAGCYLLNYFGFGGNNTILVLEKRI